MEQADSPVKAQPWMSQVQSCNIMYKPSGISGQIHVQVSSCPELKVWFVPWYYGFNLTMFQLILFLVTWHVSHYISNGWSGYQLYKAPSQARFVAEKPNWRPETLPVNCPIRNVLTPEVLNCRLFLFFLYLTCYTESKLRQRKNYLRLQVSAQFKGAIKPIRQFISRHSSPLSLQTRVSSYQRETSNGGEMQLVALVRPGRKKYGRSSRQISLVRMLQG